MSYYAGNDHSSGAVSMSSRERFIVKPITYCVRCIMPATKPDLQIDGEGICSACRSYERRGHIDWAARSAELLAILERYRSASPGNYDCIIPVSGGKDSHFQVIHMLELG